MTAAKARQRRARDRWGGDASHALELVSRYTQGRVRSIRETLEYLIRRGITVVEVHRAIAEAKARGLLDDRVAAQLWAEHWARRGYAWAMIRVRLREKGFDERTITELANQHHATEEDEAAARRLIAASLRRSSNPPRRQRSRLARTLAARGFDLDLIEQVLNEAVGPITSDAEH